MNVFVAGLKRNERSQQMGNRWNSIIDAQTTSSPEIFISRNWTDVYVQTGTCPVLHCEVGEIGESVVSFRW